MKKLILLILLCSCSHTNEEKKIFCENLKVIGEAQEKKVSNQDCVNEYNKLDLKKGQHIQLSPFLPHMNEKI